MEYQIGPPLLGLAPAEAHRTRLKRISRRQVTVPRSFSIMLRLSLLFGRVPDCSLSNLQDCGEVDLRQTCVVRFSDAEPGYVVSAA